VILRVWCTTHVSALHLCPSTARIVSFRLLFLFFFFLVLSNYANSLAGALTLSFGLSLLALGSCSVNINVYIVCIFCALLFFGLSRGLSFSSHSLRRARSSNNKADDDDVDDDNAKHNEDIIHAEDVVGI